MFHHRVAFALAVAVLTFSSAYAFAADPQVLDSRLTLQLVAREPDIVTPIGLTFDHEGRLLVVECHTHFPPEGYAGPKSDRIRIVKDTDGDGDADEMATFYEGTRATMSLRSGPDDWIYVATRMEVFRIRDSNQDDVADERENLVRLDTLGDYPHNGLGGLAFDREGRLYFGLGENIGEPYRVIGRDDRVFQGGGEGGNVYRCRADGTQLEQLATGFWNPFGIVVDEHGRVFAVENDPDASPPCRLLHIVPSGDYGYQFRYGRPGRHPLQAWNGELPGTLPMLAGTGEAPCAVIPYHGDLWVTSWGDYRIERFPLRQRGASFISSSETVVQGDENFRPVDFALAPDGSLYFTDWVDRSYEVHGKGRIWRLSWKDNNAANQGLQELTSDEQRAAGIRQDGALSDLDDIDPFQHQAAMHALLNSDQLANLDWSELDTAGKRLGALEAARWQSLQGAEPRVEWLQQALRDPEIQVRVFALRWIAEARLRELRSEVEQQLQSRAISPQLLQVTLATLEWLDTGKVSPLGDDPSYEHYLLQRLEDANGSPELRTLALRLLGADHPAVTPALLESFLNTPDDVLRREAIRTLVLRQNDDKYSQLASVVKNEELPISFRADALVGLADNRDEYEAELRELAHRNDALGREAQRLLQPASVSSASRPDINDVAGWTKRLGEGGDVEAGWRVFFGATSARCAACHRFEGRGNDIGPDLTLVGQQMPLRRLVDSILNPDREVAPRFVPWNIETNNGQVVTGMLLGSTKDGRGDRYVGTDGKTFEILNDEIASKHAATTSIMPRGLEESLTDDQLRDLIAFLKSGAANKDQ